MMFRREILEAIARGEIRLAFRAWRRPTVVAGGRLRTAIGELAILSVDRVAPDAVDEADARAAGSPSRAELLAGLPLIEGRTLYRIAFRLAGPDPRIALAATGCGVEDRAAIDASLARLDAAFGPEGHALAGLRMVRDAPGAPACRLAAARGEEGPAFKRRMRRLKELGLVESLAVGYRLSARGESYLRMRCREDVQSGALSDSCSSTA